MLILRGVRSVRSALRRRRASQAGSGKTARRNFGRYLRNTFFVLNSDAIAHKWFCQKIKSASASDYSPKTLVLYRMRPHSECVGRPLLRGRVRYSRLKGAAPGEAPMQIQWCWGFLEVALGIGVGEGKGESGMGWVVAWVQKGRS